MVNLSGEEMEGDAGENTPAPAAEFGEDDEFEFRATEERRGE